MIMIIMYNISDPDQNGESLQDSSSGVVSTTTSTFKGSYSSSESLLDSRHSGWSSPTATPAMYSKSYVRQNKNQTLMHNQTNYNNNNHHNVNNNNTSSSSLGSFPNVDIINAKLNRIHFEKAPKLMLGMKKSKFQSRTSPFQYLSDDIIVKIFSNLTTNQLCKCSRVCKLWYCLSWDPTLWTSIVLNSITLDVDKALRSLTKQLSYNTPSVCVIIERINVNNCEKLTDKGLHTISKRCPELRKLEVHNCSNITNSALFDLISNCVNLEYLNVSGRCTVFFFSILLRLFF